MRRRLGVRRLRDDIEKVEMRQPLHETYRLLELHPSLEKLIPVNPVHCWAGNGIDGKQMAYLFAMVEEVGEGKVEAALRDARKRRMSRFVDGEYE
ncbi:hypothetical protein BJ508DRAFT_416624 [Ascobolus immersus RN42]|uniref:Uncharacterized protein n=1 Tax=Ascobolus immersus RN42 TaxID=1160509 RepID=A0A3N4HYW7_ASCIM|nr:hypothetical protein BJ508DRAFT_416624 [Ascobolus immersus RN42]